MSFEKDDQILLELFESSKLRKVPERYLENFEEEVFERLNTETPIFGISFTPAMAFVIVAMLVIGLVMGVILYGKESGKLQAPTAQKLSSQEKVSTSQSHDDTWGQGDVSPLVLKSLNYNTKKQFPNQSGVVNKIQKSLNRSIKHVNTVITNSHVVSLIPSKTTRRKRIFERTNRFPIVHVKLLLLSNFREKLFLIK